jgi:NitT/TauT family transport system ATP-binding protein
LKLVVSEVSKRYRTKNASGSDFWALRDVSFEIGAGECLTIVGPSGCGKSTVLNCIGGLVPYDGGSIEVDGRRVTGPGLDRAIVFQHASLLPWRTAEGNVAYGMELQRRESTKVIKEKAAKALHLVGLEKFSASYPSELSGGMQQRVNLARALATEPDILLMDEPFGALDALTKERLQGELAYIIAQSGQAVLFITHDITEAIFLGDKVVVMSAAPGSIKHVFEVPFERPRVTSVQERPDFQGLRKRIRQLLNQELAEQ